MSSGNSMKPFYYYYWTFHSSFWLPLSILLYNVHILLQSSYISMYLCSVGKGSHCVHWNTCSEPRSIAVMTMIWKTGWNSLILTCQISCCPVPKGTMPLTENCKSICCLKHMIITQPGRAPSTHTSLPSGDFLHHFDRHTCCVNTTFFADLSVNAPSEVYCQYEVLGAIVYRRYFQVKQQNSIYNGFTKNTESTQVRVIPQTFSYCFRLLLC